MSQDPRAETAVTLARKILLAGGTGLITFAASALLDNHGVSLADQLVLTLLVGGITFLTQFLVDFEARLYSLEVQQNENVAEARLIIDHGFARLNEAMRIFNSPPLVRDLASYEIDRVQAFLRSLSGGAEVFYDGEDREWLLGLALRAQRSIAATSLATVDAGGASFEGGIWKSDLGGRYLELQRDAVSRGVSIRRIFVFDLPEMAEKEDFHSVVKRQKEAGIEVRMLLNNWVPEHLKRVISDFIVFDSTILYETTPATRMDQVIDPDILSTRLILQQDRVTRRAERFEELWSCSHEIDGPQAGSAGSQAGSVDPLPPNA